MKHSRLYAALLCAAASFAYAETPDSLDEVVVTATRFDSAPGSAPVNVTVISVDDIKKSAARTLPALLAQHAGIQVRSTDGTPDMAIDMRGFGMTGNQNTLVLLDGQRLNDIELTSIRWSSIPLSSIERIEIVNGGGSVLYGAGATGGTINIITKRPGGKLHGNAGIGAGSYDASEWQLAFSGSGERLGMRLTANGLDTSNYRVNNDISQSSLEGDLRTDAGQGEVVLKFGFDNQSVRYPGNRKVDPSTNQNELLSGPRGTSTPLDYGKQDGNHVSLGTMQRLDFGELAAEFAWRKRQRQAYFAASGGSYLDTGLELLSFTPRIKVAHGTGGELVAGFDWDEWDYDSIRATSPATVGAPGAHVLAKQSNRGAYAQDTLRFDGDTRLMLGARIQRAESQARDTVNTAAHASGSQGRTVNAWEIGLRHALNGGMDVFGKIGRSFRVATVDEVFDRYGGGAPLWDSKITMLEPQTALGGEFGLDLKREGDRLRATLYRMDLNNEIHYNAITFKNMNLSPTRRYGLELEGAHAFGDTFELAAAYSYTVAKFLEGSYSGTNVSGNDIPLVPRHRLVISPSWKLSEQTSLNAVLTHVGQQRFDNDQANTFNQKMPAYTTVDMKLSHREGGWVFAAASNNLLDEAYFSYAVASTTAAGKYNAYPMQRRNFTFNATYEF